MFEKITTTIGFSDQVTGEVVVQPKGMAYRSIQKESLNNSNLLEYMFDVYTFQKGKGTSYDYDVWYFYTSADLIDTLAHEYNNMCKAAGIKSGLTPATAADERADIIKVIDLFNRMPAIEAFEMQIHTDQKIKTFGYSHKLTVKQTEDLIKWIEDNWRLVKQLLLSFDYMTARGYKYIGIKEESPARPKALDWN